MSSALSTEQKHPSRLGIASFILSLLAPLLLIAGLIVMALLMGHASTFRQKAIQEMLGLLNDEAILVVLVFAPLMLMTALLLGIAGLLQKNRKKAFALAGTIISAAFILLPFVGFICLALS